MLNGWGLHLSLTVRRDGAEVICLHPDDAMVVVCSIVYKITQ